MDFHDLTKVVGPVADVNDVLIVYKGKPVHYAGHGVQSAGDADKPARCDYLAYQRHGVT